MEAMETDAAGGAMPAGAGGRLAIACMFLRRTIDSRRLDGPVVTLCTHPVRDGFDCVGPFMEDLPTACGLWEHGTPAWRIDT